MQYATMEDIQAIQGFKALTQGEHRLEMKLLENVNDLKGRKAMGFIKTRSEVLVEEFDTEACEQFFLLSSNLDRSNFLSKENVLPVELGKNLCERICRDHVPADMVATFGVLAKNILVATSGSIEAAVRIVRGYMMTNKIKPVSEYFRQAENYIKKGLVMTVHGKLQSA